MPSEMKTLLWVFKLIVGIPAIYYICLLGFHYGYRDSWEIAYKNAAMATVIALFVLAIRCAIKHGA